MQVKQQKKSSNKWTCVVCNQRQSVRKVFARGFVAKELRLFVQNFNMGRKLSDDNNAVWTDNELVDGAVDEKRVSKRRDWSEYLDKDEGFKDENQEEEDDCEVKFVVEMPNDAFKRPKLKKYSTAGDGGKLMKPVFARRNVNKLAVSREKEPEKSECNDYTEGKETGFRQPVPATRTCKWDSYIEQDDDNVGHDTQRGMMSLDNMGQSSSDVFNSVPGDQTVEEDVHPDFM